MPGLYEQAKALYEQGDYPAAKEAFEAAIEENEEDARAWNGLGNACLQAGAYEEAYDAYQQAIEWDEAYAPAWHGLGISLEAMEDFPQALEAYQQALRLDRDFANAWNALGALYLNRLGKPEEGIRSFQRCEFLAKGQFANNCFALFSQLPNYPFFSWRIIQSYMPPEDYERWSEYLQQTLQDATPLLACQCWLSLKKQEGEMPETDWRLWMGLTNLMMGDPTAALAHLNAYQEQQNELSLMAAYYQLQACWEFREPDTAYLQPAREKAARFLPPEQEAGWQFWKKKEAAPPLPPETYEDCYYAGLVFVYNDELDKALACFERIERDFLPAAYQSLWLCEEMVQPKKKKEKAGLVLEQEAQRPQFINGIHPMEIPLEPDNALPLLMEAVRYQELADAIEVLHFFTEFEGNPLDSEVLNSREQPPFHQLWKTRPEDEKQIMEALHREIKSRALQQLSGSEASPLAENSDALEALARARPLGKKIFGLLLVYFLAEKKLTEYEAALSETFSAHPESEPSEASTSSPAVLESTAFLLGSGMYEMLGLLESGITLPAFFYSFERRKAAGALTASVAAFLEKEKSFASFSYFREEFEAFAGEQFPNWREMLHG